MDKSVLNKRVLVVDDAPHISMAVQMILKGLGFSDITVCENGLKAKQVIEKGVIDNRPHGLVISDLHMPEMSGLELLKFIRGNKEINELPFIIYTSDTNKKGIFTLLENGASNYIIKPAGKDEFKNKIESVFEFHEKETIFEEDAGSKTISLAGGVIEKSYELLELIIETVDDYICVVDEHGDIIKINRSLSETLGKDPGELIGLEFQKFLDFELDLSDIINLKEFRCELVDNNNEKIPILLSGSVLKNDRGEVSKIIFTAKDFRNELELQRKFNYATKMAGLGEMAGGVSHEINNPLAIIQGHFQSISKEIQKDNTGDVDVKKMNKKLRAISSSISRVTKIIAGLKEFAMDSSDDPKEKISIKSLLEDAKVFCTSRFQNNDIDFITPENISEDIMIHGRKVQILQVIIALLHNTFSAVIALEKKWVKIDCSYDDKKLLISVIDSGSGISRLQVEKIFTPFYSSKGVGIGKGLGLSASKGIIEEHDGTLEYNKDNPNTCFVITLPRHND